MDLNEALEFVRSTDSNVWKRLVAEMNETTKRRDLEAAKNFSISDLVEVQAHKEEDSRKGRVVKIARGRLTLAVHQGTGFSTLSVPASMVRHCHDVERRIN